MLPVWRLPCCIIHSSKLINLHLVRQPNRYARLISFLQDGASLHTPDSGRSAPTSNLSLSAVLVVESGRRRYCTYKKESNMAASRRILAAESMNSPTWIGLATTTRPLSPTNARSAASKQMATSQVYASAAVGLKFCTIVASSLMILFWKHTATTRLPSCFSQITGPNGAIG